MNSRPAGLECVVHPLPSGAQNVNVAVLAAHNKYPSAGLVDLCRISNEFFYCDIKCIIKPAKEHASPKIFLSKNHMRTLPCSYGSEISVRLISTECSDYNRSPRTASGHQNPYLPYLSCFLNYNFAKEVILRVERVLLKKSLTHDSGEQIKVESLVEPAPGLDPVPPTLSAINFSQIAGYGEIKSQLKEFMGFNCQDSKAKFGHFKIKMPTGILLYGPPGCSKTLLIRAMATESRRHFICVKGPEVHFQYLTI